MVRLPGYLAVLLVFSLFVGCASSKQTLKTRTPRGVLVQKKMHSVRGVPHIEEESFLPWTSDYEHPGFAPARHTHSKHKGSVPFTARGSAQASIFVLFWVYQNTWSRLDGARCSFSPTCSRFGLEALSALGPVGIPYTFARLMRDHSDEHFYHRHQNGRLLDPLQNYLFFTNEPHPDAFSTHEDRAWAWYLHVKWARGGAR